MPTLLVFSQSHDYQHCSAQAATLTEAFDELEKAGRETPDNLRTLVPSDATSFDWKEYGCPDASQVSWGDEPSVDYYDDLYQKDGGSALFVNGTTLVWQSP